ncbi:uncharacterized protein BDW47DRAFT_100575 [Aspergillus candidus]|uniref:Uncharacterized protein n=1 Tax=Aspergillus candidus TaxID=41067 RepID=A0A2I2FKJ7_ASPCN|nr:hypothetical protein BDW47DRAFT_100575 [Aspergillus candidus]PLB41149.1 hypothetical protein BDW47DRAFT_100575 [Aspergillus candidus]
MVKKKKEDTRRDISHSRLRGTSRDGCGLGMMIIMSQRRRRDFRKSEVDETRTDSRATFYGSCPRPLSAGGGVGMIMYTLLGLALG